MMIKCRACGLERHNLKEHFVGGREASCTLSISEYLEKFPGSPVVSELFSQKLNDVREKRREMNPTIRKFSPKEVFGVEVGDFTCTGFVERTRHVPDIDEDYGFPDDATSIVLLGLETNRPTLVHGPTGSGKTALVEQICASLNRPWMRVNNYTDMYSSHILGSMRAFNGQTFFEYGPLPWSMLRPMIYCSDEGPQEEVSLFGRTGSGVVGQNRQADPRAIRRRTD